MSSYERASRLARFSEKDYDNSSVYARSVRSQLNSLSVDLPKRQKKYANIEKEVLSRQGSRTAATINLTQTKYPVFLEVCGLEGLNWRIENFAETGNWSIKWLDSGVTNELLQRLSFLQRVNHFPNMGVITRKNNLATTLTKMKLQFPEHYDFLPRTFLYPSDHASIRHYYLESRKRGLVKTFIVKPEAGCQGRGIYLAQDPADFEREERCVVQKYIANPLLYQGLKFDLRIYVLLSCCHPLRIYLYNEGLVRFATEKYQLPDAKNLNNFYIHLTNYAINKSHPGYQYNTTVHDMSHGHKKSLAQFFRTLKEMGFKANLYWSQIKDEIIKTIVAAQPYLLSNYKACRPQEPIFDKCFELLGFDFIIDNQDRCRLLEVNHTPSFATETPLDHIIKKNLIRDTLLMMSPGSEEVGLREELERIRLRQKCIKFKTASNSPSLERERLVGLINKARQRHEQEFKGTYELIFPCQNEAKMIKYGQYLAYANKLRQHHHLHSSSTLPSAVDLRKKLREIPQANSSSKQIIQESASRNAGDNKAKRRNIIYNYNILKKDRELPSKRALLTLPSEPHRVEVRPNQKLGSSKNIGMASNERMKVQSLSRETRLQEPSQPARHSHKSGSMRKYDQLRPKDASNLVVSEAQGTPSDRQINSFSNRIRAYRTPLMF